MDEAQYNLIRDSLRNACRARSSTNRSWGRSAPVGHPERALSRNSYYLVVRTADPLKMLGAPTRRMSPR
jgi:hypothetical protein